MLRKSMWKDSFVEVRSKFFSKFLKFSEFWIFRLFLFLKIWVWGKSRVLLCIFLVSFWRNLRIFLRPELSSIYTLGGMHGSINLCLKNYFFFLIKFFLLKNFFLPSGWMHLSRNFISSGVLGKINRLLLRIFFSIFL